MGNGLSSYPACLLSRAINCGGKCPGAHETCNQHDECLCMHGGIWPNNCCKQPCGPLETCHKGLCVCKYGSIRRVCNNCKQRCRDVTGADCDKTTGNCYCKYGGKFPDCKQTQADSCGSIEGGECNPVCGPGGHCEIEKGPLTCTKCGTGFQAKPGPGFTITCTKAPNCDGPCGLGYQFNPDGKSCSKPAPPNCDAPCGPGGTCEKVQGKIVCKSCGSGYVFNPVEQSCSKPEPCKRITFDQIVQEQKQNPAGTLCDVRFTELRGRNHPGGDITNGDVYTDTINDCACLCKSICNCPMFHYNTMLRKCWLKNTIPKSEASPLYQISAIMD